MIFNRADTRRMFLQSSASLSASLFLPAIAQAQSWPSRTIKIICGYPAGGLTDLFARAYGDFLSEKLGHPVIVENRTGAGGSIAARSVKASAPDGHTLMFTISTTLLQNRVLYKNLGYDADRDFVPIAHMSAGHLPLVVHKSTGVGNVAEFAAYARKNNVAVGSFAAGSFAHIRIVALNKHFDLALKAVQYRGEAPMWQDLAAGAIQAAIGSYSGASGVLDAGHGQAIAVPTSKRMKKLPSVPTFLEQGLSGDAFQVEGFIALVGPSGMPQEIVERLSALMVAAGGSERVQKVNAAFGIDEAALGHEEFKRIYSERAPIFVQLVRDLGLAQVDAAAQ
jgi:tripartite-type tricarboxylate transporter receptor subunit TctC